MNEHVRSIRQRDGAIFWSLFLDAARPARFVEYFIIETWIEHMRQHGRVTLDDLAILQRARSFHVGEGQPSVTHQLSAQAFLQNGRRLFDHPEPMFKEDK